MSHKFLQRKKLVKSVIQRRKQTNQMCAKTFCGSPLCIIVSLTSKPFTKPSLSLSSLIKLASYTALSSVGTIHWGMVLGSAWKRWFALKNKNNKRAHNTSLMNDWGEEEMGDSFKFNCWTDVSSGLKLSSSLGSWGGNSKPCDALAMRWHDCKNVDWWWEVSE